MGQKVHPHGYRLGYLYNWNSRWYADPKSYKGNMLEDLKIRDYLFERLKQAGVVPWPIDPGARSLSD